MKKKRLVSIGMAGLSFISLLSMAVPGGSTGRHGSGPVIKPPVVGASRPEGMPGVTSTPETAIQGRMKKSSTYGLSCREKHLLKKLAMAEAEGEDTEGKALVIKPVYMAHGQPEKAVCPWEAYILHGKGWVDEGDYLEPA